MGVIFHTRRAGILPAGRRQGNLHCVMGGKEMKESAILIFFLLELCRVLLELRGFLPQDFRFTT
jgi:hypothetical protein